MSATDRNAERVVATNRRARYDYAIEETWEAGMVLLGSEVKSLRAGRVTLSDGYIADFDDELWMLNVHIAEYTFAHRDNHEPTRKRKLLLNRREIERITHRMATKGLTCIPIRIYFKGGRAKVEIGLGKGKKSYDKRHDLKAKDAKREMRDAREA